jgi:hypothetical protein
MDIKHIADQLEITALLNTYARAVDGKDWATYRSATTTTTWSARPKAGAAAVFAKRASGSSMHRIQRLWQRILAPETPDDFPEDPNPQ